ncbi:hypothetical protein [Xenorhabdus cabanillasii]|uniref:Uncharacterized protein n=1 Tax=Xenorhabdus cabanillasii JM26 TaxID=1427517 RepID=W1J9I2_9GAMM|nr:hypothetical protein [Xenorhabdus cabanillasii]PHM75307.1 hypothetical protein Xcab_04213 [Xenorhabdus cabanillasii JM26]CDL86678.1 hypothetical protein XCR1_4330002 [Xenorhabdus cabanillasii JM26]
MTEFQHGFMVAVALLQHLSDQPIIAADILSEAGFQNLDCSELDEYDKSALRIINNEIGIKLLGLEL